MDVTSLKFDPTRQYAEFCKTLKTFTSGLLHRNILRFFEALRLSSMPRQYANHLRSTMLVQKVSFSA